MKKEYTDVEMALTNKNCPPFRISKKTIKKINAIIMKIAKNYINKHSASKNKKVK